MSSSSRGAASISQLLKVITSTIAHPSEKTMMGLQNLTATDGANDCVPMIVNKKQVRVSLTKAAFRGELWSWHKDSDHRQQLL